MSSPACERAYNILMDEEENRAADALHSAPPIRVALRQSGAGPYRLATVCLATLCAILLISIIAVTAHYKNKPEGGAGEVTPDVQKQTQDGNVTAFINKLQREKAQLQKERDELQLRLQTQISTKGRPAPSAPDVVKPTLKAAPVLCPLDWNFFSNSCYYISRLSRNWPESKSYCESQGAHLAIIHTAEEQTFIWNLLPRGHWNAFWFGITDGDTEDQWKWVDGTPVETPFWEVGEPNNHINEDCGYIVKTRVEERVATRSWYDAPCSMYWRFICEKKAGGSTAMPH